MRQLVALGSTGWTLREKHADLSRRRGLEDGAPTRLTHSQQLHHPIKAGIGEFPIVMSGCQGQTGLTAQDFTVV